LAAVVTVVCGRCGVDAGAPESAVVGWIQGRISLEEDVETCAEGPVVAVFGTLIDIVGLESLET
jgi:hypothetical protein